MATGTKKRTAKQLAKWAVEDAMNKMMDNPFYRGSEASDEFEASSEKFQKEVNRQLRKYADRVCKHIGSFDRYSEEA